MKLLLPPRAPEIENYYEKMVQSVGKFYPDLKGREHLGHVDFEAIHDLMHGLSMTVVFSDTARVRLNHDRASFLLLLEKLKTVNVSQVIYTPQALEKIRIVLREACIYMSQSGCDSYDEYLGLIDNRARAFSRREEQALKWAIVYQLPNNYTAAVLKEKYSDSREMDRRIDAERRVHLEASRRILHAVLNPAYADKIYNHFAKDYISQAFQRLKNISHGGNVIVLTR